MMFMAPSRGRLDRRPADRALPGRALGCLGLSARQFPAGRGGHASRRTRPGLQFAFFYGGLVLMVAGAGLFKSNVSALLGQLYAPGDARRQDGFMLFYMGINLGAFAAPYGAGTMGELVGWSWGFLVVGVGMVVGLLAVPVAEPRAVSRLS